LVAPELFPARISGNNFKLALCLALWTTSVDRLSRQHTTYDAAPL